MIYGPQMLSVRDNGPAVVEFYAPKLRLRLLLPRKDTNRRAGCVQHQVARPQLAHGRKLATGDRDWRGRMESFPESRRPDDHEVGDTRVLQARADGAMVAGEAEAALLHDRLVEGREGRAGRVARRRRGRRRLRHRDETQHFETMAYLARTAE